MMSRSRAVSGLFIVILFLGIAVAQETLTNDAVVKMVKAGLSESVIVTMIGQQPGNYATKVDDLITLKQEGVTDKMVAAMVGKAGGAATAPQPKGGDSGTPALDVGVYYRKDGNWTEVLPEVVNWKTGGVVKTIASAGIVKGDVNGHIQGPNSRNSVKTPLEFMVITPEGVAITEYQLIRLRPNKDYREFRTVTGGIMHVEGGATRDLVPFEQKKTGARTYEIVLPSSIGAGDYGFLPPGAFGSASSASIGKMFTFHIVE